MKSVLMSSFVCQEKKLQVNKKSCMYEKKVIADMKETETARQNRVNNRMLIKKNKQNGGNRAQE